MREFTCVKPGQVKTKWHSRFVNFPTTISDKNCFFVIYLFLDHANKNGLLRLVKFHYYGYLRYLKGETKAAKNFDSALIKESPFQRKRVPSSNMWSVVPKRARNFKNDCNRWTWTLKRIRQLCCPFLFLISSRAQNSVLQLRLFQRFISIDHNVAFGFWKFREWNRIARHRTLVSSVTR